MFRGVHDHPYGGNGALPARTALRSVAADSMSTAIAPVANSSDRSGPRTT